MSWLNCTTLRGSNIYKHIITKYFYRKSKKKEEKKPTIKWNKIKLITKYNNIHKVNLLRSSARISIWTWLLLFYYTMYVFIKFQFRILYLLVRTTFEWIENCFFFKKVIIIVNSMRSKLKRLYANTPYAMVKNNNNNLVHCIVRLIFIYIHCSPTWTAWYWFARMWYSLI